MIYNEGTMMKRTLVALISLLSQTSFAGKVPMPWGQFPSVSGVVYFL